MHFKQRKPSPIRTAQLAFAGRKDRVKAVNLAIGNVSLPVHPAIKERMDRLSTEESPFREGVVRYSTTAGPEEANRAFLNLISASGFESEKLFSQVTDGASQAMELMILGVCGPAGSQGKPLLLIEPIYPNYTAFAQRLGRATAAVSRTLREDGRFSLPDLATIEEVIRTHRPGGFLVIPYDNPTGQMMDRGILADLGRLCVKHNLWFISDEAYRMLHYTPQKEVSIWGLSDNEVPGIEGRRISIESASKLYSACGLRVGALVTDNKELHEGAVAEYTANLCSNVIGQYLFGALADISRDDLRAWYEDLRDYYRRIILSFTGEMKKALPGIIVSRPDAALYSVLDVRNLVKPGFEAGDFVLYCATEGRVTVEDEGWTLLAAPLTGFYDPGEGKENPGKTQLRIAYVEPREVMEKVPGLFVGLLKAYEKRRSGSS